MKADRFFKRSNRVVAGKRAKSIVAATVVPSAAAPVVDGPLVRAPASNSATCTAGDEATSSHHLSPSGKSAVNVGDDNTYSTGVHAGLAQASLLTSAHVPESAKSSSLGSCSHVLSEPVGPNSSNDCSTRSSARRIVKCACCGRCVATSWHAPQHGRMNGNTFYSTKQVPDGVAVTCDTCPRLTV